MTILSQLLRKEHTEAGLTLEEDEDFVYLKRASEVLAVFSAEGATVEEILHEADRYWMEPVSSSIRCNSTINSLKLEVE